MHVNATFMTSDSLKYQKQSVASAVTLFKLFLRRHWIFFLFFFLSFACVFEKVSTQTSLCLIFFPSVFQMEVQMEIRLPLLWFCGSVKHDLRHEFFSSASLSHICLCAYTVYMHNTSNAFHIFICSF